MKTEHEYTKDLTEIRSMMERTTKFLSLSGWSGILAGIYALAGAFAVYRLPHFDIGPQTTPIQGLPENTLNLIFLAVAVLALTIGTAIYLAFKKSEKIGERLWNASARRLVINMAIPLVTGGLLIVIVSLHGLVGLVLPLMLVFYGLTLLNGSKFTYEEIKYLGIIEIILGLVASHRTEYGLIFWAVGFGLMHIVYGIYLHLKYEK